jgi:hypothetical protein
MDPLSVMASVVGLLSAAAEVSKILTSVASRLRDAPAQMHSTLSEVNSIRAALISLHKFLLRVADTPSPRAAYIELDQLIATLTDAVMTFSDLEALIKPLSLAQGSDNLQARVKLVWRESSITATLRRLQDHKSSLSLMLNIIQW